MNFYCERLARCLFRCFAVIVLGAMGYMVIEGWTVGEAFYMTIITMSTVGYGETRELTEPGRLFSCLLIVVSIATITLTTAYFTSSIISGDLSGKTWRRRMLKKAAQLKDHTIICGTGVMCQILLEDLTKKHEPVVVIGDHEKELELIKKRFPTIPIIEANPCSELALADANLIVAKNVVSVLESEFDNLLVAMTVRDLSKKIRIIARSDNPALAGRLTKAGINNVICPFQLSGQFAADLIAEPLAS